MTALAFSRGAALAVALAALGSPALAFELESPSLAGGTWATKYLASECGGSNLSPALAWKDPPAGTRSFAITLFDRDALDGFGWWHWQVTRIPATATNLPEGAGSKGKPGLPKGAIQGKADLGRAFYLGPCPDQGSGAHRYVFTIYALKTAAPESERDASPGMILADVMRDSLGKASVTYSYGR